MGGYAVDPAELERVDFLLADCTAQGRAALATLRGSAEALLGATREAAASLGLADVTGVLRAGLAADLVIWDLPHENAVLQPWGTSRARAVMRAGAAIG